MSGDEVEEVVRGLSVEQKLEMMNRAVAADHAAYEAIPEAVHIANASERMKRFDPTALSFWFPKLEAAGLPVPRTILLEMPDEAQASIWHAFDGKDYEGGALALFAAEIARACATVGYPAFLRTDHTSGKHGWKRNCHVPDEASIIHRIMGVAEFSEMASLPWARWAVREFLPTIPFGVCTRYGNMPVCREFRFFVTDGAIQCAHPYWPKHALDDGGAEAIDHEALCRMDNEAELRALAEAAGRAVPGSWSIDLLETERGWYVTDMAEAHKSFHWEGCERA